MKSETSNIEHRKPEGGLRVEGRRNFPLSPERLLTPALSSTSRRRGRRPHGWRFTVSGCEVFWSVLFILVAGIAAAVASPTNSAQCTVDWNNVHQRIDGFGGGVVFLSPASLDPMTATNMDTLYGMNNTNELGLTLLRVRIDPTTNWTDALLDAQKAVAHGAGVLATPWTPPAWMKDNDSLTNGGSVLPANYAAFGSYLKSFGGYMASNGAPLRAISVQNEPDFVATYESCIWSSSQFVAFFHTNAGAFTNLAIMMPESDQFDQTLSDPTLDDAVAVTNVSIIGGHLYGNGNAGATITDYPNAHNKGKNTWMTEFLVNDQTIGTAITTAKQIHDCLTIGNMSAYIWWKCIGDANGLLNASGVPQYRGFVMAQFSRFVRPGNWRIDVSSNATPVSAYKDTNSGAFAIVAININTNTYVNETFTFTNFSATSVTPWVTSSNQSLAVQPAVGVTNSSFTYTLAPSSIVTFLGQLRLVPPVITAIAVTSTQAMLTVTGAPGLNYTLQASTNLTSWQALQTSNSPPIPLIFTDKNVTAYSNRFYRIQVQP